MFRDFGCLDNQNKTNIVYNIECDMKNKYVWLFLVCFCSNTLVSQEQSRIITLDDARNLAIETNKDLKIATEEEKVAFYEKKDAFTKYFPDLSINGGYLHNQKNIRLISPSSIPSSLTIPPIAGTFPGATLPISDEMKGQIADMGELNIQNIWVGAVSLVQPLFMGGKIVAYNDVMKNAQELAKSKKNSELQNVIVEVDAAYWQVVSLASKKKLAESYQDLLDKMYNDVTVMYEEGVSTKADVLSVAVKKNEASVALTKVDNGLALSRMLLNQLCGLEIDEKILLSDELNELQFREETTIEIPSINEAFANRSEIQSLDIATKIYKGKEKIARSEFLPQLALSANYIWTNPSLFNGVQSKFDGMWNVGVLLKIPLNFVSSSAKLNVAKAETRIQQYKLQDAKEKIELQVHQSAFKLNEAYKKYISAKSNMDMADENLRYANVGFEEGVIPASDALAAHTAWLSAHSDLIDSQIDIKLTRIYLDKALGRNLK